jgi:hypothetical protein
MLLALFKTFDTDRYVSGNESSAMKFSQENACDSELFVLGGGLDTGIGSQFSFVGQECIFVDAVRQQVINERFEPTSIVADCLGRNIHVGH